MRIEFNNISKEYSDFTLNIPNLSISPPEVVGLVGNNGAGKTTLLRALLDLIELTTGEVLFNGKSVATTDEWKQYTGSFLDKNYLIDFFTFIEYVQFCGNAYGMSNFEINKVLKNYEAFYQEYSGKKLIREFSSGNAQKTGIIAAMISNPELLILDEPHTNLDPRSQLLLKKYILALKEKNDSAIIISSHNLDFVLEICDRIILIDNGKIIQDMKKDEDTLKLLKNYFEDNI